MMTFLIILYTLTVCIFITFFMWPKVKFRILIFMSWLSVRKMAKKYDGETRQRLKAVADSLKKLAFGKLEDDEEDD